MKSTVGSDPIIWKYLAIVEKGDRKVVLSLGNIHSEKLVTVRGGQTTTLNFRLTTSE